MPLTFQSIILFIVLLLWCSVPAYPQDSYEVLDWDGQLSWHTYLMQEMHEQYDKRKDKVEQALTSPEKIRRYQEGLQSRYNDILGSFPAETPLNADLGGSIRQKDYRIQKLVYESFPDHHVTANLYIPEGEGPFPAVLLFCGHEQKAKATSSYQKMAILLAQNNFVVMVIDPISQSERFQLTAENGEPLTAGGTTEHTLLNVGANLVGTHVMNYEYWDNKRGLDYLLTRTEVDTSKIGVLGNSGGGTMSTYFMSLNKKVKVAAVASWVTTRERSMEILGPQDGCQWIPYEGRDHLEISDFMMMNGFIPTLILAGKYDFVDYVGTKDAYHEMKHFYTTLGRSDEIKLFSWSDGHGISQPKREEAAEWFNRWFHGDSSNVKEGDLNIHTERQLQVTETGQVNADFEDEYTIQEYNTDIAHNLESQRNRFQSRQSREDVKDKIKALLGFRKNQAEIKVEYSGAIIKETNTWQKVILRRKGEVPVPLLVAGLKQEGKTGQTEVWLSEESKESVMESKDQLQRSLDSGKTVIVADLRGTGELKDPEQFNNPKYYDSQYRNNQISLHIGKPVVGQRVQDILAILDFIEMTESVPGRQIEIYAEGFVASPALHAAVFDSRIDQLFLSQTIRSYVEMLENPMMKNGYSYVVPDALKYYDLPDLTALIGSEKVTYKMNRGESEI